MPSPAVSWADNNPLTAKSLNLALYTSDGTNDNLTGIAFHGQRPITFEAYRQAVTLHSSTGGSTQTLAGSGSVTPCWVVMDTAGFFGQTSDLPGLGYYQFQSGIFGTLGDGVTPGGWHLISHFSPITFTSTLENVGADLFEDGVYFSSGTRQVAATTHNTCPFFLDLVNTGAHVWAPAVRLTDSASATTGLNVNTVDPSGETPRFSTVWVGIAGTSSGQATFTSGGTYSWTAPQGVTQVTATVIGAGAGGGGGNGGGAQPEYGGGGGGGGEQAQTVIGVTPTNNYTVTVGTGGTGGAAGISGTAGGVSTFAGDTQSVTGHGGNGGGSATTTGNGAGGAGGSGTAGSHVGGSGASGATATHGGGGGGSGGTSTAGNAGSGASGATAVPGGGPGGSGGQENVTIVQYAEAAVDKSSNLTIKFGSMLQAGNTVVACVYSNGNSKYSTAPTLTLSDGTVLDQQLSETTNGGTYSFITGIYTVYDVSGGETSVVINAHSSADQITLGQAWEVSGLGPSPSIDTTSSTSGGSGTYTVTATATSAPDIWVATVGAQRLSSFSINSPESTWTSPSEIAGNNSGNVYGRLRSGYHIATSSGSIKYSGSFSTSGSWQAMVIALTASSATVGNSPAQPPGGGGGGGLGQNGGGNGDDGSVVLTWTAQSNSNYGTPLVPNPLTTWDNGITVDAAVMNGNTGVRDVVNFLSNPPLFRNHATSGQSITTATKTAVTLGTSADTDNYGGWSGSASTYTIQRNGIYLIGGFVPYTASSSGMRQAGVSVNGTVYWGPGYIGNTTDETIASKVQMFSLLEGDTVQLYTYQTSGGALTLSTTNQSKLFLTWLCKPGTPGTPWTPPTLGWRWQSGTPASQISSLFTQYLSNDLNFLVQRPYLLSYQSSAQTGLTASSFSTVTMDTVAGIVHGDNGDPYSGWTSGASNNYAAPVSGWYLVCGEVFATNTSTTGAAVIAALQLTTSGGYAPSSTPDQYQNNLTTTNASAGGGSTFYGLYYLNAGETITPQIDGQAYGATYGTTAGTANNGGTVASHLEMIWISE